jgi:quercetin dioxygenase-like cupin family protein
MPARTFDWRDDPMGTVVATPQVRARFMRFEPGVPPGGFHTHEESDAVETFVVIEGALRFDIGDESVVATAGQAVVAQPREKHRVSCVGDEPGILYLTVTPHRQPTHTHYDADGNRLPTREGVVDPTWQGRPAMGPAEGLSP